jgi:hypothetical protein
LVSFFDSIGPGTRPAVYHVGNTTVVVKLHEEDKNGKHSLSDATVCSVPTTTKKRSKEKHDSE